MSRSADFDYHLIDRLVRGCWVVTKSNFSRLEPPPCVVIRFFYGASADFVVTTIAGCHLGASTHSPMRRRAGLLSGSVGCVIWARLLTDYREQLGRFESERSWDVGPSPSIRCLQGRDSRRDALRPDGTRPRCSASTRLLAEQWDIGDNRLLGAIRLQHDEHVTTRAGQPRDRLRIIRGPKIVDAGQHPCFGPHTVWLDFVTGLTTAQRGRYAGRWALG